MSDLIRLLSLQDANTRTVLAGTLLLGIACAVVGVFAVLRRRALVGDAVAHAALPGVCVAYLLAGERHLPLLLAGALAAGVAAAAFIAVVKSATRIKEDAAIALAIGGFFGMGIALSRIIQNQPEGNRAGLDSFIFGKAASMVASDVRTIGLIALVVVVAAALLYKEFKVLAFDQPFAHSQGWPTRTLDLALMALVCLCAVAGLPAVGVVLLVALMVIPPAAARFWTDRLGPMLLIAAAFGGASGLLGTALSATLPAPASGLSRGWPAGPLVALVAAAIFLVSLFASPTRGIIADLWRRAALSRRIAMQNLLRSVFERLEPRGDLAAPWRPADLARPAPPRARAQLARRAMRRGLAARTSADTYTLTPRGQDAARRVVRAHRLWELFLIEHADIAADHVDRDADLIEHVLPAETLASLEARLVAARAVPVPASPHPTLAAPGTGGPA